MPAAPPRAPQVRNFMPGVAVISMDNYNDASKLIDDNFDDPRLTDYELLLANIADLRQGKPVQVRGRRRGGARRAARLAYTPLREL